MIIGEGPSAHDISRELSKVAKEVHLASRSPDIEVGKLDGHRNIWQHSMVCDSLQSNPLFTYFLTALK